MTNLQLDAMEVVLQRNQCSASYNGREIELALTNLNLILTAGKLGKRNYLHIRIALKDIRLVGGNPQIAIIKDDKQNDVLTIFCNQAAYQIAFSNGEEAHLWKGNIINAMSGNIGFQNELYNEKKQEEQAEARANSKGIFSKTLFNLTKTVASAVRSGYDGIKTGLGLHNETKKNTSESNYGSSIADFRQQEERAEKEKEKERLLRAKLALEFENEKQGGNSTSSEIKAEAEYDRTSSVFCTNCGEKLTPNSLFCHNCGKKVQ